MIPPWRHHFSAQISRCIVTYKNRGEHIHRRIFQLRQRQQAGGLALPADVAHQPADRFRRLAIGPQNLHGLLQVVGAALGRWVVERNAEVPRRRAGQPLFNDGPRRQPVGERNHAKIVCQRRAQHSGPTQRRRQAGHNLDLYPGVLRGQFQQRAGHTVDPRITGADQRHGFAALRGFQRPAAAVNLPRHAGGVDLLFWEKRPHQLHIDRVAAQHISALQRGAGLRGQKLRVTGAKAHHIDKVMVHFSISNSGQRTARPQRRSRRPAPISEGTAPRPRPAPPHAHRHCPRR